MQQLVENPYAKFEDKADVSIPSATLQIYQHIAQSLGRPKTDTHVNRASSATMCAKRRWYQRKGFEGVPLTPRKIVNFLMGDLAEKSILHFVREGLVGDGKLYSEIDLGNPIGKFTFDGKEIIVYEQKTLTTKIGDLIISSHADGFGKRNSDGKWESIECKSAANWGFQSFKDSGPEDYLKQSHTIMASEECKVLGVESTRYFYLRKETGHLWDRLSHFDPVIWETARAEFQAVMKDEEMPAPFKLIPEMSGRKPNRKPTGRMVAQFPCTYCPYLNICKGEFTLEWKEDQWGNMKPNYVFEEDTNPFKGETK